MEESEGLTVNNISKLMLNNQDKTEWKRSTPLRTYSKKTSPMSDTKSRYGRSHKPRLSCDFVSTDRKVSQYLKVDLDNQMHYFKATSCSPLRTPTKTLPSSSTTLKKRGRPPKYPIDPSLQSDPGSMCTAPQTRLPLARKPYPHELGNTKDFQAPAPTSTETLPVPLELQLKMEPVDPEEEVDDNIESEDLILGDLAWACVGGFPFWPCAITRDPFEHCFTKIKYVGKKRHINECIHVRFFGDNGRRSWISKQHTMPYLGIDHFQSLVIQFSTPKYKKMDIKVYKSFTVMPSFRKSWQAAVSEAESLRASPRSERLQYFVNLYPPSPPIKPLAEEIPTTPTTILPQSPKKNFLLSEEVPKRHNLKRKKDEESSSHEGSPAIEEDAPDLKRAKLNESSSMPSPKSSKVPKFSPQRSESNMEDFEERTPRKRGRPQGSTMKNKEPLTPILKNNKTFSEKNKKESFNTPTRFSTPKGKQTGLEDSKKSLASVDRDKKIKQWGSSNDNDEQDFDYTPLKRNYTRKSNGKVRQNKNTPAKKEPNSALGPDFAIYYYKHVEQIIDDNPDLTQLEINVFLEKMWLHQKEESKSRYKTRIEDVKGNSDKTSQLNNSKEQGTQKGKPQPLENDHTGGLVESVRSSPRIGENTRHSKARESADSRSQSPHSSVASTSSKENKDNKENKDGKDSKETAKIKRGLALFSGIKIDKVCQVCFNGGGVIVKCRGPCNLWFHKECSDAPRYQNCAPRTFGHVNVGKRKKNKGKNKSRLRNTPLQVKTKKEKDVKEETEDKKFLTDNNVVENVEKNRKELDSNCTVDQDDLILEFDIDELNPATATESSKANVTTIKKENEADESSVKDLVDVPLNSKEIEREIENDVPMDVAPKDSTETDIESATAENVSSTETDESLLKVSDQSKIVTEIPLEESLLNSNNIKVEAEEAMEVLHSPLKNLVTVEIPDHTLPVNGQTPGLPTPPPDGLVDKEMASIVEKMIVDSTKTEVTDDILEQEFISNIKREKSSTYVIGEMDLNEDLSEKESQLSIDSTGSATSCALSIKKGKDVKGETEEKGKAKGWMCKQCSEGKDGPCFICGQESGNVIRCCTAHCGKVYHEACALQWPQSQLSTGSKGKLLFYCPQHACHTCISDNPSSNWLRYPNDRLVRCVRCPTSYHYGNYCVPAGSEILSSTQIICPKHYVRNKTALTHLNAAWCFLCAVGGSLICCDLCPNSFHAECLKISPPDGSFICEDCETGRYPLYGEIVWAKLGKYRWWPAKIMFPYEIPANITRMIHMSGEFAIQFFGTYDFYWVNRGRVFLYHEGDGTKANKKSKTDEAFFKGVEEASREFNKFLIERADREAYYKTNMKPPKYVKIQVNKPCNYSKSGENSLNSMTACDCDPNQSNPCGPDSNCLNRLLLVECNPQVCPAGEKCCNQNFEKRSYPRLEPYQTESRGWGLKTLQSLKKGDFVIEYVGEIIDEEEYQRRLQKMQLTKTENFYFLTIDKDRMLDAGPKGNMARFMNHSCDPNCETQKWTVNGDTRVGLFAIKAISPNDELVFNYNLETIGNYKVECKCSSANCAKYIGAKPLKNTEDRGDSKPKRKKVVKSKVEKPVEVPVDKSTNKSYDKVTEKQVGKPFEKQIGKPFEKQVSKQVDKALEKQVDKSLEKQVDKTFQKHVDKPFEKEVDKSFEKEVDKSIEKEVDKPFEKEVEKQDDDIPLETQEDIPQEKPYEMLETKDDMLLETKDATLETKDDMSLETKDVMSLETKDDLSLETKDDMSLETKDGMSLETKDGMSLETKDDKGVQKKITSEESCFTCGEGGKLLLCDMNSCPKAYHLTCLGLTKHPAGGWVCPWHQCSVCSKPNVQKCCRCINSYCSDHAKSNISAYRMKGLVCFSHHLSDSGSESASQKDEVCSDEEEVEELFSKLVVSPLNRTASLHRGPITNGHI